VRIFQLDQHKFCRPAHYFPWGGILRIKRN
jgi:hypothetical protein